MQVNEDKLFVGRNKLVFRKPEYILCDCIGQYPLSAGNIDYMKQVLIFF